MKSWCVCGGEINTVAYENIADMDGGWGFPHNIDMEICITHQMIKTNHTSYPHTHPPLYFIMGNMNRGPL